MWVVAVRSGSRPQTTAEARVRLLGLGLSAKNLSPMCMGDTEIHCIWAYLSTLSLAADLDG